MDLLTAFSIYLQNCNPQNEHKPTKHSPKERGTASHQLGHLPICIIVICKSEKRPLGLQKSKDLMTRFSYSIETGVGIALLKHQKNVRQQTLSKKAYKLLHSINTFCWMKLGWKNDKTIINRIMGLGNITLFKIVFKRRSYIINTRHLTEGVGVTIIIFSPIIKLLNNINPPLKETNFHINWSIIYPYFISNYRHRLLSSPHAMP